MVVDKVGSLHMALAPFSIAASAKRVTITFPSLDCIPEDAISNKYFKQPPAWESLTFAGIVRYGFVGTLPLKPSAPGSRPCSSQAPRSDRPRTSAVRHASTCACADLCLHSSLSVLAPLLICLCEGRCLHFVCVCVRECVCARALLLCFLHCLGHSGTCVAM